MRSMTLGQSLNGALLWGCTENKSVKVSDLFRGDFASREEEAELTQIRRSCEIFKFARQLLINEADSEHDGRQKRNTIFLVPYH